MSEIVQLNSQAKLSEHFTLGEMTKSSSHPEVYNIPSHEAIANLKRVRDIMTSMEWARSLSVLTLVIAVRSLIKR